MSEEDKKIENEPIENNIVEDKFEGIYGHSPYPFPEGTSIEDKVKSIEEKTRAAKASRSTELENKMKNIAELNKELEARKKNLAEEERANSARLDEGLKRDGISIEPKEPAQERTPETSIQTDDEKLNDAKGLQEDTKKPKEPAQERTPETSMQTDDKKLNDAKGLQEDAKKPEEPVQERTPEAQKIYPILDKGEEFNQDKAESKHSSEQRSPKTENKQPDAPLHEHQKQPEQPENTQEHQEKEGIWNRLVRLAKKILEKLIGKEGHVEHINNKQEIPQKNTSGKDEAQEKEGRKQEIPQKDPAFEHEEQGKETSFIEINGEKIYLEPGKDFSHVTNDKTLSINITYTNQPLYEVVQQNNLSQPKVTQQNNFSQPKVAQQNNLSQPEVTQQNNLSQPKVAQQNNLSQVSMNLNINGEGRSIPYGGNFSCTNNNLKISVTHCRQRDGRQQERIDDKILSKARTMGKDLREHGAQIKEGTNNVGNIAAPMSTIDAPVVEGKGGLRR